eukprot:gene16009-biopygen706
MLAEGIFSQTRGTPLLSARVRRQWPDFLKENSGLVTPSPSSDPESGEGALNKICSCTPAISPSGPGAGLLSSFVAPTQKRRNA